MKHYSTIIPGWLWAGDLEAAKSGEPMKEGAEFVVSTMHTKPKLEIPPSRHGWIEATDDGLLLPTVIHKGLGLDSEGVRPTFIHCQLGQNRSSAMVVCWLLGACLEKHDKELEVAIQYWGLSYRRLTHPEEQKKIKIQLIRAVCDIRTRDLSTIGRGEAEISPAMRDNINNYLIYWGDPQFAQRVIRARQQRHQLK
jgi:hypothetical protein